MGKNNKQNAAQNHANVNLKTQAKVKKIGKTKMSEQNISKNKMKQKKYKNVAENAKKANLHPSQRVDKEQDSPQTSKKQKKQAGNIKQEDQRFDRASYDPKFLKPKQTQIKTKIDSRFNRMFTDPKFSLGGEGTAQVDKYGRKITSAYKQGKNHFQNKQLKQFYQIEEENIEEHPIGQSQEPSGLNSDNNFSSESEQQQVLQDNGQSAVENEGFDDDIEEEAQQDQNGNLRKWMEQYAEESSESLSQMPIDQIMEEENEGPQVWSDSEQHVVRNQKVQATRRLALCNYDWMNINARDLMILFNSFKPTTGYINSVKVFQSLLGKQRMESEETFGPQGIWKDEQPDDFANEQKQGQKWRNSWAKVLKREENTALDEKRLRAYQKERLKYFYAVIECDSKKTADQIYKQCDGNQFEHSNLQFDLRFIPEDLSFDNNLLKEECNQLPLKGEVKNFVNRAMGHSKVELTWEDPELSLPATLKKKNWGKMTDDELQKIDWATYLNEGDVEEEDQKLELFLQKDEQNILPDWKKECNKKYRQKQKQQKLVISFDGGFNTDKTTKKADKSLEIESFPSLKQQNKHKKSQKQLRRRAEEEKKRKREQLELIAQNPQQEAKEKSFKPNLQDTRFKAVFQNPAFSIDPTDPKFDHRKSGEVFKRLVERNKSKGLS